MPGFIYYDDAIKYRYQRQILDIRLDDSWAVMRGDLNSDGSIRRSHLHAIGWASVEEVRVNVITGEREKLRRWIELAFASPDRNGGIELVSDYDHFIDLALIALHPDDPCPSDEDFRALVEDKLTGRDALESRVDEGFDDLMLSGALRGPGR